MKAKLLFAGLLMAAFTGAKAQTTIYSQDFSVATGLTVIDGDGDAKQWGLFTGNATTAAWGLTGNFAGSRSWDDVPLTPNNFLLTPEIVIPDSFGATTLSFKLGSNDEDFPAEHISIYLAPTSANTADLIAALTPVFSYTLTAADALTANVHTVDVSAYAGQTVKIVMRHHDCADQDMMYLDDLLLTQETLGTESFIASQFTVSPNPATDVINVSGKNNSTISAVSLTDINGRVVKQTSFNNIAKIEMNISDLSAGVYMMNIKSSEGEATKKIIKN